MGDNTMENKKENRAFNEMYIAAKKRLEGKNPIEIAKNSGAEFDEENFRSQLERIEVPAFNHLVYVLKDGRREERVWQDKSRRDSWTDKMKEQAAEHAKRRNRK